MNLIFQICFGIGLLKIRPAKGDFYIGKVAYGLDELIELNGVMTVRSAIINCETNYNCSGFTYHGTVWDLDDQYEIYFYRFIHGIHNMDLINSDWSTYIVDRKYAFYPNTKIGTSTSGFNAFQEMAAGSAIPTKRAEDFCSEKMDNCTAISLSRDGILRVYERFESMSLEFDRNWITLIKIRFPEGKIKPVDQSAGVDHCCPVDVDETLPTPEEISDTIPRQHCSITEKDFVEKYVRPMKPVILTNCQGYEWVDQFDLSLEAVTLMFHDNSTRFPSNSKPQWPVTGFTHTYTPNDHMIPDDEAMQYLEDGYIRLFERTRNNPNCHRRNNLCKIFENFTKPSPIPDDLFVATKYENPYNWVIYSSTKTGSHPHNDPDLTGAWNYLINGLKYWVIFPREIKGHSVDCKEDCSEGLDDDAFATLRWFKHVLPQLRNKTFYGKKLMEGVQRPGEAIFLPHGVAHSVLNIQDNVAVTENFLFVDGLSELAKYIAIDDISIWRPNWDGPAWSKLYYGGYTTAKDRKQMRLVYDQVSKMVQRNPELCTTYKDFAIQRFREKFVQRSSTYGSQNGQFPVPPEVVEYVPKKEKLKGGNKY